MTESSTTNGKAAWRRVLGVDPAAAGPTGFGILETDGRIFRVVNYGAFQTPAKRQKTSPGAALQDVHTAISELLRDFAPHVLAIESVFTALNIKTALRLAEVRGVVLLAAEQCGVEVFSYSPREVKACVAGYGHADKKQMQLMVKATLGMTELPEPSDAADALAVAFCHLQGERLSSRFGVSKSALAHGKVAAKTPRRRDPETIDPRATLGRNQSIQIIR